VAIGEFLALASFPVAEIRCRILGHTHLMLENGIGSSDLAGG